MKRRSLIRSDKDRSDALGNIIYDHFLGKPTYEIIEFSDGYLSHSGGAEVYFSQFNQWPQHLRKAIKYAQGRVLDIGCGAGRVCLYLQDQGFSVTGIDVSPLALKVCKRRGVKTTHLCGIESIKSLKGSPFETVVMFGNGFGLFGSAKKVKTHLRRLAKMTSEDARILAESRDPFFGKTERQKKRLLRSNLHSAAHSKIRVRYKDFISDWFNWISVSPEQMVELLVDTGWTLDHIIIDSKQPYYVGVLKKV